MRWPYLRIEECTIGEKAITNKEARSKVIATKDYLVKGLFFDELIVVFCYLVHNLSEEVLGNDLS